MLLGITITNQYQSKWKPIHVSDQNQDYFLLITEDPSISAKSIKVLGKIYFYNTKENQSSNAAKIILYFAKDSLSQTLKYGDVVKLNIRLNEIKPPQNPHEFNYKKYLEYHNIYFQAYQPSGSWQILDHQKVNPIRKFALNTRKYLMNKLGNTNLTKAEFAVSAAILLGQDEILDAGTRQDYAGAGAMHVLCVSGLHVGIIYLVFNFLLGFLNKRGIQKQLKTFFLIFIIWGYALITGLSPSVMRASVMLSFIIVGEAINKKGNIYNSIAASAFLLLLINPLMIMEVGFQLSYTAVIGIVALYPLLKKYLYHTNQIVDKVLSILIVSVAAQIGTFPLAIFYFHQFPVYFLLTNLVVIFSATLIIYFGFLFLIVSGIPLISSVLNFIFKMLVNMMNKYVAFIESLPGSTLKAMVLSFAEITIIYFLIIGITQMLLHKSKSWFVLCLSLMIVLLSAFNYRNFSQLNQYNMLVYDITGQSVYEFQNSRENIVFMDSILIKDEKKVSYHLSSNWCFTGIKNPTIISFKDNSNQGSAPGLIKNRNLFFFANKSFLKIDNENINYIKNFQSQIDYLIISDNVQVSIPGLYKLFKPKLIILDSSNSGYFTQKIVVEAETEGVPVCSVNDAGALVIPL